MKINKRSKTIFILTRVLTFGFFLLTSLYLANVLIGIIPGAVIQDDKKQSSAELEIIGKQTKSHACEESKELKSEDKPFNGRCDRRYIESLQNLDDLGYRNFNTQFKEPLFIKTCPKPSKTLKDAYKVTWGHVVKLNSDYFRWPEFSKKKDGQISIVILGDSMTFGVGMPVSSTYPYLVDQKLNHGGQEKYKVYSLAIPGGTLEHHLTNLKQYYELLDPDLIVYGAYHNDLESKNRKLDYTTPLELTLKNTGLLFSKMGLKHISKLIDETVLFPTWEDQFDRVIANKSSWHWVNFATHLDMLKQYSKSGDGQDVIFFYLNGPFGKAKLDYRNPPAQFDNWIFWGEEMEREAKRRGLATLNAWQQIQASSCVESLAVNQYDYHPNEKLHKIYADVLTKKLRKHPMVE